jgi:hypothetical protein
MVEIEYCSALRRIEVCRFSCSTTESFVGFSSIIPSGLDTR